MLVCAWFSIAAILFFVVLYVYMNFQKKLFDTVTSIEKKTNTLLVIGNCYGVMLLWFSCIIIWLQLDLVCYYFPSSWLERSVKCLAGKIVSEITYNVLIEMLNSNLTYLFSGVAVVQYITKCCVCSGSECSGQVWSSV